MLVPHGCTRLSHLHKDVASAVSLSHIITLSLSDDHSNQHTDVLQNISLWKTLSESHVRYTGHFHKCYFLSFSFLWEVGTISLILWDEGVIYIELGFRTKHGFRPVFSDPEEALGRENDQVYQNSIQRTHTQCTSTQKVLSHLFVTIRECYTYSLISVSQLKYEGIGKFAILPWKSYKLPFYNNIEGVKIILSDRRSCWKLNFREVMCTMFTV